MIYIDDCVEATVQYLQAPKENLKRCVYNMGGISFSPEELVVNVQKLIPGLTVEYELCPVRSQIADQWPRKLDDTYAQEEWGLNQDNTLFDLAHKILDKIDSKYKEGKVLNMQKFPITTQAERMGSRKM